MSGRQQRLARWGPAAAAAVVLCWWWSLPPSAEVSLEVRVLTPVVKSGEQPRFEATLTNRSGHPITVPLPGDGSTWGFQMPSLRWTPQMVAGRCGNWGLGRVEVVTLATGTSVLLTQHLGPNGRWRAGTYTARLEIENDPRRRPLQTQYKPDPVDLRRLRNTHRFTAVSNTVTVRVVP